MARQQAWGPTTHTAAHSEIPNELTCVLLLGLYTFVHGNPACARASRKETPTVGRRSRCNREKTPCTSFFVSPRKNRWSGDGNTLRWPSNMPSGKTALSWWKTLWSLSSQSPSPKRPASTCFMLNEMMNRPAGGLGRAVVAERHNGAGARADESPLRVSEGGLEET